MMHGGLAYKPYALPISLKFVGTRSSDGVVLMEASAGLTANRARRFQYAGVPTPQNEMSYLEMEAFPVKSAEVEITGTATLTMQGTNQDPTVEANWDDIGNVSSTGSIESTQPYSWIRFEVSGYTSGDITVALSARSQ